MRMRARCCAEKTFSLSRSLLDDEAQREKDEDDCMGEMEGLMERRSKVDCEKLSHLPRCMRGEGEEAFLLS